MEAAYTSCLGKGGSPPAFLWILPTPPTSLATLGQWLDFSPQFPHLWNSKACDEWNGNSSVSSHSPGILCVCTCCYCLRAYLLHACPSGNFPHPWSFRIKSLTSLDKPWAPSAFWMYRESIWQLYCMEVAGIPVFPLICTLREVGLETRT